MTDFGGVVEDPETVAVPAGLRPGQLAAVLLAAMRRVPAWAYSAFFL